MKKRFRIPRRRLIPHPRCTLQITLATARKKAKGKISFWWPNRSWNLKDAIQKFLDGTKFGAAYASAMDKQEEQQEKKLRAKRYAIRKPRGRR